MRSRSRHPRRQAPAAKLAAPILALSLAATFAPSWAAPPVGERFASPTAAAEALAGAWRAGATPALLRIFGPGGANLVSSGDPVAERQARQRLATAYAERHRIEFDGKDRATLVIGANDWPYPIPLVRGARGWTFDVAAGEQQIIDRRIGRNELNAIRTCRAYVRAQHEYAARSPAGGVHGFAEKLTSSPGARDGLYWPASTPADESPLGPLMASAEAKGYGAAARDGLAPFEGYYFRILTAQGPNAPGGARSYVVDGRMTGGFALVAYPARYGASGVMTFIVNQAGIVFEKNLGARTAEVARAMVAFDPDASWRVAGS